MEYRIDCSVSSYEQVYACADLFKHKLYVIALERNDISDYLVTVEVRNYYRGDLACDLTKISSGRFVFRKTKRLVEFTEKEISDICRLIPSQLRQRAFEDVIPYVYLKNKRVTSQKYKRLLPNFTEVYEKLEEEISLRKHLEIFK